MKNCKNFWKRGISLALALMMCLSLLPVNAFAADAHEHVHESVATLGADTLAGEVCKHENTEFDYVFVFRYERCKDCGKVRWNLFLSGYVGPWVDGDTPGETPPDTDCNHNGTGRTYQANGNGTHDEFCAACGNRVRQNVSCTMVTEKHVDATCTKDGVVGGEYCAVCGYGEEDAKATIPAGHDWGDWTVETAATCVDKGSEERECSKCHTTETREIAIDADAHDWNNGEVTTAATCTAKGVKTFTCANDPKHTKTEEIAIDADAHEYGPWHKVGDRIVRVCKHNADHIIVWDGEGFPEEHTHDSSVDVPEVPATCTATGTTAGKKCSICGQVMSGCETTEKLEHDWDEWSITVEPTATTVGEAKRNCQRENCTELDVMELPALGDSSVWTLDEASSKAATCAEEGQNVYTSEYGTVIETIPAKGHEWSEEWSSNDDEHWYECSVCHEKKDAAEHTYGDPAYSFKLNTGNKRNGKLTVTQTCTACGHVTSNVYSATYNEPTCTAAGSYRYRESIASGYQTVPSGEPALGHTKPTGEWLNYSVAGYSDEHVEQCKRCKAVIAHEKHQFGEVVYVGTGVWPNGNNWAPTCTEPGYTTRYCSVCGKDEGHHVPVEPLGHDWSAWTITTAPTATTAGEAKRDCQRDGCNESETKVLPALGGEDGEWTYSVTRAPDCTNDGEGTYTYSDGTSLTVTIPALGHTPSSGWKKSGTQHWHFCKVCNARLDLAPHTWDDGVVTTPATCEGEGVMTYSCTVCGQTRTEPIPANGHTWGDWTVTTAPTADTEGAAERTCACGTVETKVLPALGGNGGGEGTDPEWTYAVTVEPGCTTDGEGIYTYTEDGSTVTVTIPATGHAWGDWTVAIEPTYAAEGLEIRTCANCGGTQTRVIAALELPAGGLGGDTEEPEIEIEDEQTPLAGMPFALNPEDELTRGHLMYVLHWFDGEPEAEISTFIDVAFEAYYSTAIGWAQDENIARGTPDNRFMPDVTVTRGQMEVFLARYVEYLGLDMEVILVGDANDLMFWGEAETILNEFFASLPVEA